MKKHVLKPIITDDMRRIYNFFLSNSKTYSKIAITSEELSVLTGYAPKDILKIIKSINNESKFKLVILGSAKGYKVIDKENKATAKRIINEREVRCNNELIYIHHLAEKIDNI